MDVKRNSSTNSPYSSLSHRAITCNPMYSTLQTLNSSYVGRDNDDVRIDLNEEELQENSSSRKCSSTIDPASSFHRFWLSIVSLAVVYNMYLVVARTVFWELENLSPMTWFFIDYACDAIYVVDIVIRLFTGYLEEGVLVTNKCKILQNYFCTCRFVFDVASVFPTDVVYLLIGTECRMMPCPVVVRLNRVLKFPSLREFFYITEVQTRHFVSLRVSEMAIYILIFVHWNACFYFAVSCALGFGSDPWVYPDPVAGTEYANLSHQYVTSVYWSTFMLTSHSAGAAPTTNVEHLIALAEIVMGVFIFASILGNVTSIINQKYAKRVQFQSKMNTLKAYLERRKVDEQLRAKTLKWCDYVYRTDQPFDEKAILAHLQEELQAQIARDIHKDTLRHMTLFSGAGEDILKKIALKLKLNVFCPGDYVCRQGDIGKDMFVKKSGKLAVYSTEDCRIYSRELDEAQCFGDLCLVDGYGSKYGCHRMASVVSVGYSEIYSLSKSDLDEILREHPEFKENMVTQAKYKQMKLGLAQFDCTVTTNNTVATPPPIDERYA